jgi:heme/copper-type cytochrome/quinol oxidase subunit 2
LKLHRLPAVAALASAATDVRAQDAASANYSSWSIDFVVVTVTAVVVCVCVLLHYEVLNLLSSRLARLEGHRRRRVLFGIFGFLSIHVGEI